ncbi:MAG TPA: glycosyltransferase family 4 protein [Paludibacter sp.]
MKVFSKPKLIRTSTVAISLDYLLKGQLSYLQKHYDVVAVSGEDEDLENVARREKVRTVRVPMSRKINLVQDLKSLWKLYQLFRKEKPQIVHSITPKAGLLSMTAAYLAGVPVRMHTFTGLIFPSKTGLFHWLLKNMDRCTCAFANHIVPEGKGVKNDLIRYRITRKPLKVIGHGNVNGIDTTYFSRSALNDAEIQQTRNTWNIQTGDFVFVFIGRLVKDKGINELVFVFVRINKLHPNTKLLLVGPFEQQLDPVSPVTLDLIKTHPAIIHTGFQKDVRPYLAISDALVFPSYREGFPNVPMQAGAMGLPSIVTDINGCNEIIQDGVNGIIIPAKDAFALENAMIELLENREKRERLAQNARPLIVERYEQQMVWQLIKQEYDEQLKRVGARL